MGSLSMHAKLAGLVRILALWLEIRVILKELTSGRQCM